MENLKLCESDYRFMLIVWNNEPLPSGQLVKLCAEILGWKKPTTYTTLKKLCNRGFLQNENTIVTSLVSRERVQSYASESFVNRTFAGSLPSFIAAFTRGRPLSHEEADEIQKLIDASRKENSDA
jgi:BlaI family penicillinase repressor